ncbi:MAG: 23S rRNA (adenine(2030)-N(6))-methyltransferase RlmJ [Pseudomonadales bacterium]
MLSYRHAFHAGSPADVLKHLILVQLLEYLTRKEKACWYIDTHAGAGVYALASGFAARKGEYRGGIGRLWERSDLPEVIEHYRQLVSELNPDGKLIRYPGSPWFAQRLLRVQDQLWLHEMHPADCAVLEKSLGKDGAVIAQTDGLQSLRGHLPPQPRRALVLIDPSYEVKADYLTVITTLEDALQRFPTGTYAIWYPLLETAAAGRLPQRLRRLNMNTWLHAELWTRQPGPGMWGSGMFIINPPYTLPPVLETALPCLAAMLGEDGHGGFELDWHLD